MNTEKSLNNFIQAFLYKNEKKFILFFEHTNV